MAKKKKSNQPSFDAQKAIDQAGRDFAEATEAEGYIRCSFSWRLDQRPPNRAAENRYCHPFGDLVLVFRVWRQ